MSFDRNASLHSQLTSLAKAAQTKWASEPNDYKRWPRRADESALLANGPSGSRLTSEHSLCRAFFEAFANRPKTPQDLPDLNGIRKLFAENWQQKVSAKDWQEKIRKECADHADPIPPLDLLPSGSWLVEVNFRLISDLISKDDTALHVLDNPVKKDRVRGIPEYWGPSWKGILRHAFRVCHSDLKEPGAHDRDIRLFGNQPHKQPSRAGRLRFFTSRFNQTGFAVIHPTHRTPKSGVPIFFETVPSGTQSHFRLLYCPFDATPSPEELRADATAINLAIRQMFLLGIGAKSSSGFGEAEILGVQVHGPAKLEVEACLKVGIDPA